MSKERAIQLIDERVVDIDKELACLAESYPSYVEIHDRESVGEVEGSLSGLRKERASLERIKEILNY